MAFNHKEKMAARNRRLNSKNFETMEIHGLLHGPEGVGRLNGRAVFVPRTVPGDKIKVEIMEKKKSFSRGEIVNILEPSKDRRTPPCKIFGRCGACQWMHIDYACQLKEKEKAVLDSLKRIGHIEASEVLPSVPSPEKYNYRRRIKIRCRMIAPKELAVGFRAAKSFRVISHDKCWIYKATMLKALHKVGRFLPREYIGSNFMFFCACDEREGKKVTSLQLTVQTAEGAQTFQKAFEEAAKRVPIAWELRCEETKETLYSEKLPEMGYFIPCNDGKEREITVAPFSFFQANLPANYKLVERVIDFAGLTGFETVADLYSGAGNFTVALAPKSKKIYGIENDEKAVKTAIKNCEEFEEKVELITNDVESQINEWIESGVSIDTIILDPPREGCKEVIELLTKLNAKKIVFCSCEPSTLARDIKVLAKSGYKLNRLQVFDLFPQTYHVETLAELILES